MSSSAAVSRARERLIRAAGPSELDDRALRANLVEEIARLIDFDYFAWLLTDPATSVGSSPLAETPKLAELPQLIRLKYATPVCRWTVADRPAVMSLHEQTNGQLAASLMWRELMSAHDVVDVASVVFVDRFGCWGFLDLWRCGPALPFSVDEKTILADIAPALTACLRRCQARVFSDRVGTRVPGPGPIVMLLSSTLDVRAQTPETERVLRILVPPSGGMAPVPAAAYNVAAQLLAVEAGVDDHPPTARVHVADGLWMTLRAARMGGEDPPELRDIAVTIEQASPAERVDLFSRALGLSARESDVVDHLVAGGGTREVAQLMVVSEHTVSDHLKSIFAKTGCHSRRELLARVLGS